MTMPTMIYETTQIPVKGDVWLWHGFEPWKVLHIDETDDIFGEINRVYIVLLNQENNQLRTVWMTAFLKRWIYEKSGI